jgi:hypothetical protein
MVDISLLPSQSSLECDNYKSQKIQKKWNLNTKNQLIIYADDVSLLKKSADRERRIFISRQ